MPPSIENPAVTVMIFLLLNLYSAVQIYEFHYSLSVTAASLPALHSNNHKLIKRNMIKNPSSEAADQLVVFKRGRGVELGSGTGTRDSGPPDCESHGC